MIKAWYRGKIRQNSQHLEEKNPSNLEPQLLLSYPPPTHTHTQCEETNPDEPGSLSQQSSLWKNKDKNPSDSFWILMGPISKGEQEHRSLPQVLKSAPKSWDSSPRSPLKNSTMKMNLYFKSKLVRYPEMKAEEEVPSKRGTAGLFPCLVFSPRPAPRARHDAEHIIDAQ